MKTALSVLLGAALIGALAFMPSCVSTTESMIDPGRQVTAEQLRLEAEILRQEAVRRASEEAMSIQKEAELQASQLTRDIRRQQVEVQNKILTLQATNSAELSQIQLDAELIIDDLGRQRELLASEAMEALKTIREGFANASSNIDAKVSIGLADIERKDAAKGALFDLGNKAVAMSPFGPIAGLLGLSTVGATLFGIRANSQKSEAEKAVLVKSQEAADKGWNEREEFQKKLDAQWDEQQKIFAEKLAALMTPVPVSVSPSTL